MVARAFRPSTQETEAGGSLRPGLQIKFQISQGFTEKPCIEKQTNKKWDTAAIVRNTVMTACVI